MSNLLQFATVSPLRINHLAGLRGVAILFVILFHMLPGTAPQGYYGVDIFLVLSGYFLLGRQLDPAVSFTLPDFLKRRLARLLPPLIAAGVFISLAGVLIFPAYEASHCALDGRRALLCWYNIYLTDATSSYFSQNTRAFPMMHLWYMSVLIQSYALFAVLLYLWHRFKCRKRARVVSLALLGLASLCLQFRWCVHVFGGDAAYTASTYYWTSTRIWEFAAGALAYLVPAPAANSRAASAAALLSVAALAAACFLPIPESSRWTPVAVLLCLVVIKCGGAGSAGGILGCKPFVWLGTVSFSLYLMHWPVVCFAEYFFNTGVQGWDILPVSLLMLLLGIALYYTVEKPSFPLLVTGAAWCTGILLCTLPAKCYNLLERLHPLPAAAAPPANAEVLSMAAVDKPLLKGTESFEINTWVQAQTNLQPVLIHLGDSGRQPNFVLLGDSHARHFVSAFSELGKRHGWSGVYLNTYVHPFWDSLYEDAAAPGHYFDRHKGEALLAWLARHPQIKFVFIAQWWNRRFKYEHQTWDHSHISLEQTPQERLRELAETCRRLRAIGKVPVILTDTPVIRTTNPHRVRRRMQVYGSFLCRSLDNIQCSRAQFLHDTSAVQDMFNALEQDNLAIVLRAERGLFINGIFNANGDGNESLMDDNNHLSSTGARRALESVAESISHLLQGEEKV